MKKIFDNRLLWGLVGGIGAYWGIGAYVPNWFVSQLVAVMLLVFGGFSLVQNATPAWDIIVRQHRDAGWPGSHIGIVGKFLISSGLVFSGCLRFYVNNFDDWTNWIGSLTSNFSSVLIAVGMAMMFAAPQIDTRGFRIEGPLRFFLALVIAFVTGCVATSLVMGREQPDTLVYAYPQNRPACRPDMPVWGSSTGKYHLQSSPYRAMMRPVVCFKTAAEAEAAGFEPVR